MQADIARLCGPTGLSIPETNDGTRVCPRPAHLRLTTDDVTRERDPAYLAQMRARKAMLQAQAMLLQAQDPYVEAVGAAD
jgi:hypothetical protein